VSGIAVTKPTVAAHDSIEQGYESLRHPPAAEHFIQVRNNSRRSRCCLHVNRQDSLRKGGLQRGRRTFPAGIAEEQMEFTACIEVVVEIASNSVARVRHRSCAYERARVHRRWHHRAVAGGGLARPGLEDRPCGRDLLKMQGIVQLHRITPAR
jgi:hypothetical protein